MSTVVARKVPSFVPGDLVVADPNDAPTDGQGLVFDAASGLWVPADLSAGSGLTAHLADTTDAHDASAISYNGAAGLSATEVEAALDELDSEKENAANKDTDTALAANSDTKYASQKAIKAYVDGRLAAADAVLYKGVVNCSGNPNYPAADAGHLYRVSVAGKIGGASGTNVEVGDTLLCLTDATASGTQAAVGANWDLIQANIDGAVVGPASATGDDFVIFDATTGKLIKDSGWSRDTDVALVANSDSKFATQKAVKAYADAALALKAPLASPTFTGTPAAPTPAASDNSTKLATTAYADGMAPIGTRIEINPMLRTHDYTSPGTWVVSTNANMVFNGYIQNNATAAQNDEVGWDLYIPGGTWSISIFFAKLSNCGIASVRIDDVEKGTIDTYAGATTYNQISTVTGAVIAAGKRKLSFKMATKNGSSSAYGFFLAGITLRRTA